MSKNTTIIVFFSLIVNFCLTFVWGGANFMLFLNWLFPFALTMLCMFLVDKTKKSQSTIIESNKRLDILEEVIDS